MFCMISISADIGALVLVELDELEEEPERDTSWLPHDEGTHRTNEWWSHRSNT